MKFPDGQLNEDDEGALQIMTYIEKSSGRVIIDFGKKISWLGFDKASLQDFILGLGEKLNQITK